MMPRPKLSRSLIVPCGTLLFALLCPSLPARAQEPVLASTPVYVALASENAEAAQRVQTGIQDWLLGWDEMAAIHFRSAVMADPDCALGWCGLMLTEAVSEESRSALEQLLARDELPLTPPESALMNTWLQLLMGDHGGAGEEFAARAATFRQDAVSACSAVRLLHDVYDKLGDQWQARPAQKRALELATLHYQQRGLDGVQEERTFSPQDALLFFTRAWVEESAPTPSDTALWAATHAVLLFAEHPMPHLLKGHLLFKQHAYEEALSCVHAAARMAEKARLNVPCGTKEQVEHPPHPLELWPLELRAKLYESTILWLMGKQRESLLLQAELLKTAQQIPAQLQHEAGAVLLHWEARTLPLRLLMLSPKLPTDAQVAAAAKAALPEHARPDDPLLAMRDCLRFCLVTRQRAAAGKGSQAMRCVQSAEKALQRLQAAKETCAGQGAYVLSAWTRACEACQLAILAAKAAAYPDTAEIWLQSLDEQRRPTSLLMPPVLPQQNR